MDRVRQIGIALALAGIAVAASACGGEEPVGNRCFIDQELLEQADGEAVVNAPALNCSSRLCLHTPLEVSQGQLPGDSVHQPLCTATCDEDADCERAADSTCEDGFTCMVPKLTGRHCCIEMCVCKDFLDDVPEEGFDRPEACDPDNDANQCCNLPGRGDCS